MFKGNMEVVDSSRSGYYHNFSTYFYNTIADSRNVLPKFCRLANQCHENIVIDEFVF